MLKREDRLIYLDNSATTQCCTEAAEVALRAMTEVYGNPSSLHLMGIDAEKLVEKSRKSVGQAAGFDAREVYFTSGGTEGNNMAIYGLAMANRQKGRKIITSAVEHPSLLEAVETMKQSGFHVELVPVDEKGEINYQVLEQMATEDTSLISVMAVNNETGTKMDLDEISRIAGKADALFHVDGVQGFCKEELSNVRADAMTVSGHKVHGPKGVGALMVRKDIKIKPLLVGGGQERGFRSGTENVPAIAALGKAVDIALGNCKLQCNDEFTLSSSYQKVAGLRSRLVDGITTNLEDVRINTPLDNSCPYVLNMSFLGTRGEVLLHFLEQEGIMVSTGSACSSNKKGQSHVLGAMGLKPKEIEGAIRFSFSRYNTEEEIDITVEKITEIVKRFRRLGSFR